MKHLKSFAFPVIILGMIFTLITCKDEEVTEGTELYGKWDWLYSRSGSTGNTINPATEGYSLSMEFRSTRMVEFRQNNAVTSEKAFSIAHDSKISNLPIIKIEDDLTWSYSVKGDTLFLYDICKTCYDHMYLKAK